MDIQLYVGADIAANSIQIDWQDLSTQQGEQISLRQQRGDFAHLLKQLTQRVAPQHIHVIMEATGNYWMTFAEYLHQAGCHVSVLNPSQAKHFAQARLQRSKTDRVDAYLLREYDFGKSPGGTVVVQGTSAVRSIVTLLPRLAEEGPNVRIVCAVSPELFAALRDVARRGWNEVHHYSR